MKSKKYLSRILLASSIGAALFLSACSGGGQAVEPDTNAADNGAEDAGDAEVSEITVTMPVIPPFFQIIPVWVAQEEGFFDEFDLKVNIESLDSGITALRGSAAGAADIAYAGTPSALLAHAEGGGDLVAFYSHSHLMDAQLLASSDVKSCEDLKGKVVGIDDIGGFAEVLSKLYYTSCGLTQDDVTYANIAGAQGQALGEGAANSAVVHVDQAEEAKKKFPDAELHALANFSDVAPMWSDSVFVANSDAFAEKRDALVRWTAAMLKTIEFINDEANKDRVVEIGEQFSGRDQETLSASYDFLVGGGYWADDLGIPQDKMDFTIQEQVDLGNLAEDKAPTYDQFVDTSIYDDALSLLS